jgi:hypothetical protein
MDTNKHKLKQESCLRTKASQENRHTRLTRYSLDHLNLIYLCLFVSIRGSLVLSDQYNLALL